MNEAEFWAQHAPPGWRQIVSDLVDDLDAIALRDGMRQHQILGIKEKWGCLDVTLTVYTEALLSRLEVAEEASRATCIRCGGPGAPIKRHRGWMQNTCQHCLDADKQMANS